MGDFKSMLQSRTVWAGIVGFIAVLLDAFGVGFGFDQQAAVDAVMKTVEGMTFLAAILFRVKATKRIV